MQIKLTELRQRWAQARLKKSAVFWIAIAAILLAIYLGFSQAGWVTAGTADRMAVTTAQEAIIERLAPICVAQFNQEPQRDLILDELNALTTTAQRTRFVSNHAWAAMPGEMEADIKVAAECANQLMAIDG